MFFRHWCSDPWWWVTWSWGFSWGEFCFRGSGGWWGQRCRWPVGEGLSGGFRRSVYARVTGGRGVGGRRECRQRLKRTILRQGWVTVLLLSRACILDRAVWSTNPQHSHPQWYTFPCVKCQQRSPTATWHRDHFQVFLCLNSWEKSVHW
jgi:hypothetical protein